MDGQSGLCVTQVGFFKKSSDFTVTSVITDA